MPKLHRLLSTFVVVLLAASPARAERNTLCDDGGPLDITCSVSLPNIMSDLMCGANGLVALQAGCYLCVDASTCLVSTLELDAEGQQDKSLPKADGNDISVLLQDQAEHSPEESAFEQAAAMTNANLAVASPQAEAMTDDVAKPPEVSNWLFAIPVCLAVVSLGLAVRARVPSRRHGFQRLQDHNRRNGSLLFQEDINPFCSSEECDEDVVIETAGHFQGDPSNSESEEAQFLPSAELEEDEVTQAESEAIKQAVLLHIKQFDDEEEEQLEI